MEKMVQVKRIVSLVLGGLFGGAGPAVSAGDDDVFFERHIRPLLANHCYECHSAAAEEIKGGLRLDDRSGWEKGGDSGPVIVAGNPAASLLLRAVSYEDPDLQMPPKKRLDEGARGRLHEWIVRGARGPRLGTGTRAEDDSSGEDGEAHWSFQAVADPKPPAMPGSTWAATPLDRFVEQRRSAAGLEPAPDAGRHAILRRLCITLTGLPPTPEQIAEFLADDRPGAMERLTDRLLSSPRYGEQFGRHWLDVTRFAESSGGGRSLMFKNAWRFRDYVIRAFNQDLSFDTLIKEHIAGDLWFKRDPPDAPRQRERLIGSGFLALGPTNYELQDKELLRMEVVDEQIDSLGRAFLGMTLGCARCHDHKFDPVSTREYYALAGIFRSTKTLAPGNVSGYVETPLPGPEYAERMDYERELKEREGAIRLAAERGKGRARELMKALQAFKQSAPPEVPKAMSVRDQTGDEVGDCQVHLGGAMRRLGERVPRGFPALATPPGRSARADVKREESGRMALAEWLTDAGNPLTARVYVNRLWHHLFGAGLVRTVDNFGRAGERPSHPHLLDYLASEFVSEARWSTKRLVRTMVLSRTFQLGQAEASAEAWKMDPENRLWWRAQARPLSAESLRDAMLQVSGDLDLTMGGLTIVKFSAYDNGYRFGSFNRRTVYAPAFRNARLEILNVFDAANPNMVQGRRAQTTLATQALYLMNSPFVMQQAAGFAKRLVRRPGSDGERLRETYLHVLGRPPSEEESWLVGAYLAEFASEEAWARLTHSLFASVDFRSLN